MATIYGGTGDDLIQPGTPPSYVDGADLIYGNGGNDTIYGGGSTDTLYGGIGADRIYGGDGNDIIFESDFANGGADAIYGGAGIDTIDFSGAPSSVNVTLSGGNAIVDPFGANNTDSIYGFENIVGTAFNDVLVGDTANNVLTGLAGADALSGGAGLDTLYGGVGADTLYGGADADYLSGGNDDDRLFGDDGNDTLEGGPGGDFLDGGTGVDTLTYANSATAVNASLATNTATGEGADTLANFENLTGSGLSDTLTGNAGANVIDGGAGSDTINAGAGNDTILGGTGDDVITGGPATEAALTVPLSLRWSTNPDESAVGTGTVFETGGVNVNVTYTAGVANEFTTETGEPIYVGSGEPFNPNSAAFLNRPGAGTATQIQFDFSAASNTSFANEVTNLQFRISDIDKQEWTDRITVTAFDANGNPVAVTITETSAELTVTGNTVLATGDNTSQSTLEGSALFSVAGPVSRIVITYDNAANSNQYIYLSDIHFDARLLDNDSITGGDGNDSILGGAGDDTLIGLADNDTLYGGLGADRIYGGTGNDVIDGGDGNDTIMFGSGADIVYGGAGDDTIDDILFTSENGVNLIYGGAGNDSIWSGNDADTLYGDAGNDYLSAEDGNDVLYGGADTDTVLGGAGNDVVYGDAGNDRLYGGADADTIFGGSENDTLYGDAGQDMLYGGTGRDIIFAGDDQDLVHVSFTATQNDVLGAESVFGGGGGTDNDTLRVDITGFGWTRFDIAYDPLNSENGTLTFFASDGTSVGTLVFNDIERLEIVCFTTGTRIMTDQGAVPVEDLRPGDMVLTRDNGLQPLGWIGKRHVTHAEMRANPDFQPVRIGSAALSGAGPDRAMLVSPQHRILIEGARAEMHFGECEVLVPAKFLLDTAEVTRAVPAEGVTYVHILFDQHEIVLSDGIWTESFQPAARTLSALDASARNEVLALFPELATDAEAFPAARLSLKSYEAKVLFAG